MSNTLNIERMKNILHFIECNLDYDIDCQKLAELACYSKFHFHRLFKAYVGESVYAFRKRLLLERASKHLQHSNEAISEIAYKCGYDNQASFNKAFRKKFSLNPGDIRRQMISIKNESYFSEEWINNMKPEIVDLIDIAVISVRSCGNYEKAACDAWSQLMSFAYANKLMNKNVRMFGISYDNPNMTEPNLVRYDACLDISTDINLSNNIRKQVITGGKYAKFIHTGSYDNFKDTYAYIFSEWLPSSNYKLRDVPCFDIYLNRDPRRTKKENLKTEIYIPIEYNA